MAFGTGGLGQAKSDINVTPLIDVLLVLLIIFMIVTPLMTMALHSAIPRQADHPIPSEYSERQLVVSIRGDGRMFLNRDPLSLPAMGDRVRKALAQRGQRVVFLDADDGVPYGTVVQVLDILKAAGAEDVAIVTESLRAPTPISP